MYMCIFSNTFYCCYQPLPLRWAFASLWSFPFFPLSLSSCLFFYFPLFYNFNFLNLLLFFSTFTPLFAFPTILFPLQLIFNIYKSSVFNSV